MQFDKFRIRNRRRRDGYVLLVVLAVSVLVITVLGTLAKVSLRRGVQAIDAERSLQQRWGALSLQRAVLKQASEVFEARELIAAESTPPVPPPRTVRAAVTIGGVTYDLLLGDEDAKLNLNSLYHHAGEMKTQAALSEVLGPAIAMSTQLTPASEPLLLAREGRGLAAMDGDGGNGDGETDEPEIPDAFRSWGEVFDLGRLQRGSDASVVLPNVTTGITCWGNGQLNIRRASDQAILAVVGSVVQDGGARRLLQRYRRNPATSVSVLLQTEVTNRLHRERLKRMLSETSTNFSIWIHASSRSGQSLQHFVVSNRDEEGVTHFQKFAHSY